MLNFIIRWSITHRILVLVLTLAVTVLGVWSLRGMRVDVLPDINKPTVSVFAEAEGLAAEEVEQRVVAPIEASLMGSPGIERVRSSASFGLAIVNVEFRWGSDILRNRQLIQERLTRLELPEGVRPVLGPIGSVMGEIVWAGMTSESGTTNGMDLRTLADWTVRPALLRVPGVLDVIVLGGDVEEWQINISAERLRSYGLSFADIAERIRKSVRNRGAGILVQDGKEFPLRVMVAPRAIEEVRSIGIGEVRGRPIILSDIAVLEKGASPVRGSASVDGKPGVVLRILKQPDAETLVVTRAVDVALASLQTMLPQDVRLENDLFRQEWFIHAGLKNVIDALRDGTIFVIIILLLFLMNLRVTVITLSAIPLSILVSVIIFRAFGLSINVMLLGGLAVAIGELVDDAIVDVENIHRRLRLWKNGGREGLAEDVVFQASSEVRNSIVYATVLVAIAFTPIFFIPGVEGKLLAPLGLAYVLSLVASLGVSLTVTPALSMMLLPHAKDGRQEEETAFVRRLKHAVEPLVRASVQRPKKILAFAAACIMLAGGMFFLAGKEGIPPFNEGSATISAVLPVGTDLATSNAFASRVEQSLGVLSGVRRVSHTTGRAGADPHDSGANTSEIQVVFEPGTEGERERYFAEIQKILERFPEANFGLGQPITHKMEELLSGVRAPIVIKVFGDNFDQIRVAAERVRVTLAEQDGVKNAQVQREVMVPELRLYPARERLGTYGISPGDIAEIVEQGFIGMNLGEAQEGSARIPIMMRYDAASRGTVEALRDMSLPYVGVGTLSSAADITLEAGRNRVSHEGGKRTLTVSANYQGRDIVGAVERVRTLLGEGLDGVTLSYEGSYKSQKENSRRLALLFLLCIAAMFLVLYRAFRSVPIVLLVLANIPMVLIGAMVAIWLTGGKVSLAHLVGFVSLAGIVSRNGIMLIGHCLHLVRQEGLPFSEETVVRGTLDRLVPVLMTAATAALALVPLMLAGGEPGKELLHPLAVVIFGGLVSSTLMSIFLMPSALYRFGRHAGMQPNAGASEV